MSFQHYLITRFSVPFKEYESDKNGNSVRTEEWLSHRFNLFNKYCLPSVKGQSEQGFKWLVFFDTNTPERYLKEIEKISSSYKNFIPTFVTSGDDFKKRLIEHIRDNTNDTGWLITSRIDNDDAIHKDYISVIQTEAVTCNKDTLLNFKWGIQLDVKTGILYKSKDESNPFISRVCKYVPSDIKTVFEFGHHEAYKYLPVKQLTSIKGWFVVIHDKNVINSIGGKPVFNRSVIANYNINTTTITPKFSQLLMASLRFYFKAVYYKFFK